MPTNYPVIIGTGQLTNHPRSVADAIEPAEMMAAVARSAEAECGATVLSKADSVQVVNMISWSYSDAPGLLAGKIGADPVHKVYTAVGGETPQRLINETAQAIIEGRTRIALLAGAEALASRRVARKEDTRLTWHSRGSPQEISGDMRMGFSEVEARHGATLPTRMYPLFENALRAHSGRSIEEHQRFLGALCSRFTEAAADNPYSWFPQKRTPEEITTVRDDNRWVCFPYPKLMNSIIEVDQAAAVIMTGSQTARELGIPEDRLVYLHGCGDTLDRWFVSDRVNYHSSPAIRAATQRALGMAGITVDDVAMFDLYSCFPSAVQLAAGALGIGADDPRGLTVTGGLPYFGGPGNNYVMHSIATMTQRIRAAPEKKALVTGLGWFATKHSAGVYSGTPPQGEWKRTDPAADQAAVDAVESPPFLAEAEGEATIETYTVSFDRDGEPETGIVIGRLTSGERFFANTPPDRDLLWSMTRVEFVGRAGKVSPDAATQRNVFTPA